MNRLLQDIRYGLRMLAKAPGFTFIAVLTLALGIGANTAIFSVVDAVLLSPLPYPHAEQLVSLYWARSTAQRSSIPYPNFLDWQRENKTFSSMAAYNGASFNMTGRGEPERLVGLRVSANFFSTLDERLFLGRAFHLEEDQLGAGPVAILGKGFWEREFAASTNVIGQSIPLDGTAFTIVGVARGDSLILGTPVDVFVPLGQWNAPLFRDRRLALGSVGVARLKPGVSFNQAQADMDTVEKNLAAEYPAADAGTGVFMVPLKTDIVGDISGALYVLLGAVAFVLLIACANVASLLLARSTGRAREFAIRAALGATQGRVVRQLLTESLLLSTVGGAVGLLIASWGTRAAMGAVPQALPRAGDVRLNALVLIFTFAISILAGVLFGLVPALKTSQPDLHGTLKEGGRGASGARHRTQNVFVVAEMTLAIVLLAGAGLMIRSIIKLAAIHPGFNPEGALTFHISPSAEKTATPALVRASLRELTGRFEEIPGAIAASPIVGALPLEGESILPFWKEGTPKPASENAMTRADWFAVGPDYLKAMEVRLERGRFISATDTEKSPPVVVIDESFAHQYYPNQDPIGQRVNLGVLNVAAEIIGVVGRVRQAGLNVTPDRIERVQLYVPLMQLPDSIMGLVRRTFTFVIRTGGEPAGYTGMIRDASAKFDSQQVLYGFTTLEQIVSNSIATQRFTMVLLGAFAALALLLSAVGVFGVISYLAGQRTHEIGIRMALGAERRDVLRMVLGQGLRVTLAGVAIGLAAAFGLTRLMSSQLYGVGADDPATFAGVAILLTLVALVACYIPARRAMRVDPMVALRYE